MNDEAYHDHDDDGNCIPPQGVVVMQRMTPTWRFSGWDVANIAAQTIGGFLSVAGQGFSLMAQEFGAMANWKRSAYDESRARAEHEAAQQQIADQLRSLVDGTEAAE